MIRSFYWGLLVVIVLETALNGQVSSQDDESILVEPSKGSEIDLHDETLTVLDTDVGAELVPLYTFAHSDVLFVGMQNGTILSLDANTGEEQWRLDTDGGSMVSHHIVNLPDHKAKGHPLAFPFAVKGLWLHLASSATLSDTPFLHVSQMMQRPHFRVEGVSLTTTTSVSHYDVDERGLLQAGQHPVSTSPVVHIVRYNVHIRARQVRGFEWNITVGSIKVSVSPPSHVSALETEISEAFPKRQPFHSSRDRKRDHLMVDEELNIVSYVSNERLLWSKQIPSSPVAAFTWRDHHVSNIDLLGSDTNRVMQLTLDNVEMPTAGGNGVPHLVGPGETIRPIELNTLLQYYGVGGEKHPPQPAGQDPEWSATFRLMHLFFIGSITIYLLSILGIASAISQRKKLRQAWRQLDQLQSQLKEQQRVNAEGISPGLLPSQLDSVSMIAREETNDSLDPWDLPPASSSSMVGVSSGGTEVTTAPSVTSPNRVTQQASLFNLHYTIIRRLGGGGGGIVFEARHKLTNTTYAIKMIALPSQDEEKIMREAVLHSKLEHKNVVRFFFCWIEELTHETSTIINEIEGADDESETASYVSSSPATPTTGSSTCSSTFGPPKYVFIQMEYFQNGTLADYLNQRGKHVSREENLSLLLMMIKGLEYLHDKGIIHRDLKPTNIFLTDEFVAKIGDFGLSYVDNRPSDRYTVDSLESAHFTEGAETLGVGSPLYSSPEQLQNKVATCASDVYALGVLAYELYHYFGGTSHERIDILQKLRSGVLSRNFTDKFPQEASLFLKMTDKEAEKRPTVKEVHDTVKRLLKTVRSENATNE